jgi:hypothetical protein
LKRQIAETATFSWTAILGKKGERKCGEIEGQYVNVVREREKGRGEGERERVMRREISFKKVYPP